MLPGMGATGSVGRGWGMLPRGQRVTEMPLGAGGYRDAAIGVPVACVPMGCSTILALRAGNRGDLDCPNPRVAWEAIAAPCQGSWRVPTVQPGCHDNRRQPALLEMLP